MFLDKKTGSGIRVNEQIAEELRKPVIKKLKRRKVYARFKGSIWKEDLAEMGSLSSKSKNVKYLLCVIDIFTKFPWVKALKDKKVNQFLMLLSKSNRLLNLIVNQINYGLIKEENFITNLWKNG